MDPVLKTSLLGFPPLPVLDCQCATVHIVNATSSPSVPLVRDAIYIPALAMTFELGRIIKKSIYGEVVGGSQLLLDDSISFDENFPCFQRLPMEVAIKKYEKRRLMRQECAAENPDNELAAMRVLSDMWPFFLQLMHGISTQTPPIMSLIACCADEDYLYAIMPYLPSQELFDRVATQGGNGDFEEIKTFLRQMTTALTHMRLCGVAHRDMSLENTLVLDDNTRDTGATQYVVIDFGMALRTRLSVLDHTNPETDALSGPPHSNLYHPGTLSCRYSVFHPGLCGKRGYIAPEIFANQPPSAAVLQRNYALYEKQERFQIDLFQCDVWGLGVMLFMFVTGLPPFSQADVTDARFKLVARGRLRDLLRHWQIRMPQEVEDLLVRMLEVDPLKRITVKEILALNWLYPTVN